MNGARALLGTLVASGVDVCFANPGTSEMHLVAALDDVTEMRAVLALFEGVATGAADGYGRITDRPAATLLHLGPGLANGLANLHNARRARTPLVNVVGDHATYHQRLDAPLQSDVASLARPNSGWYRSSARAQDLAADTADAVSAALGPPGTVATLVVPADVAWSEAARGADPAPVGRGRTPPRVASAEIEEVARVLRRGEAAVLFLGGTALRARGLRAASRVANATGATLLGETFPAHLERGAGLPTVHRLNYLAELAEDQLAGTRRLVLAGATRPVAFFAYPGRASDLVPEGAALHCLAGPGEDVPAALEDLAEAVGAPADSDTPAPLAPPDRPSGPLNAETLALAVGALLSEGAVVVDEANTSGRFLARHTAAAPPHHWLTLTGGAIGQGLPVATGAAVGAGGRSVLCLEADGSAMYTLQSLWTQAREGLNVTTVVLANRSYAILNLELARVGATGGGERAGRMLSLAGPTLDFVALARGMGVPAARARTADELVRELELALNEPGPALVEAILPGGLG